MDDLSTPDAGYHCYNCSRNVSVQFEGGTLSCTVCKNGFVERIDDGRLSPAFSAMESSDDSDHRPMTRSRTRMTQARIASIEIGPVGPGRGTGRGRGFASAGANGWDLLYPLRHNHDPLGQNEGTSEAARRLPVSGRGRMLARSQMRSRSRNPPQPISRALTRTRRANSSRNDVPVAVVEPSIPITASRGTHMNVHLHRSTDDSLSSDLDDDLDDSHLFIVGNAGDYAWGPDGMDTIVNQLLNQMDTSGPPPMAKEKILEIPFIDITNKHVSENIQCTICCESYDLNEKVRTLPCDHIFHDQCIQPWLILHATCPVCRKLLCDESEVGRHFAEEGRALEAIFRDWQRVRLSASSLPPNRRPNIRCFRCHRMGHIARECNRLNEHDSSPENTEAAIDAAATDDRQQGSSNLTAALVERNYTRNRRSFFQTLIENFTTNGRPRPYDYDSNMSDEEEDVLTSPYITDPEEEYFSDEEDDSFFGLGCEFCGGTFGHDADCSFIEGCATGNSNVERRGNREHVEEQHSMDRQRRRSQRRTPTACEVCGKMGHLTEDCWGQCVHCNGFNHRSEVCWHAVGTSSSHYHYNGNHNDGGGVGGSGGGSGSNSHGGISGGRGGGGSGGGPSSSGNRGLRCFQCGQFGHKRYNCTKPKQKRCDICGPGLFGCPGCSSQVDRRPPSDVL